MVGYILWPACQHPDIIPPSEPDPSDTTKVLTCEASKPGIPTHHLTELDLINKRIKGKFNIHFTIDTTSVDYKFYPSKLHFYEGAFDVEIVD